MENNEEEKKSISRYILYGIAIILVFFTLIQFYQVLGLQTEIVEQEEDIEEMVLLKDYLKEIRFESDLLWTKLTEKMLYIGDMVDEGLMTEVEANISVELFSWQYPFAETLILTNLFIWNESHIGGYDEVNATWAIWNETRQGGFVVRTEYEWIFTENVISVLWLPKFWEISQTDPRYSTWDSGMIPYLPGYSHTIELLSSRWAGVSNEPGENDYTIQWMSWSIDFQAFDAYIQENYLHSYGLSVKKLQTSEITIVANNSLILMCDLSLGIIEKKKWTGNKWVLIIVLILGSAGFLIPLL